MLNRDSFLYNKRRSSQLLIRKERKMMDNISLLKNYIDTDIKVTNEFAKEAAKRYLNSIYGKKPILMPRIKNVIFNDPATIVFWSDNTKTVVKAQDEPFDPEKGLAMAICKRALGNEGNYYNEIKKWLLKEENE